MSDETHGDDVSLEPVSVSIEEWLASLGLSPEHSPLEGEWCLEYIQGLYCASVRTATGKVAVLPGGPDLEWDLLGGWPIDMLLSVALQKNRPVWCRTEELRQQYLAVHPSPLNQVLTGPPPWPAPTEVVDRAEPWARWAEARIKERAPKLAQELRSEHPEAGLHDHMFTRLLVYHQLRDHADYWYGEWEKAFPGLAEREAEREERKTPGPRRRGRPSSIQPLPPEICFFGDRINKGAIEGFSQIGKWVPMDKFFRGHRVSQGRKKDFSMLFGVRTDPGEEIWACLLSRGEDCIKAHYALWHRLIEQTGGEPGEWALIRIEQFCSDMGYTRHKGAFRREHKIAAMQLLEAMSTVELIATQTTGGKQRQLKGPLWLRGLEARERDIFEPDLLSTAGVGDRSDWTPAGFVYGPGLWFHDPAWRKQNQYMGYIGAGLLQLSSHKDQTAIRVGGYLGTLARINHYRTTTIQVGTLLERIGMADLYPRDPGKLKEKLLDALEKLVSVRVIYRYRFPAGPPGAGEVVPEDAWAEEDVWDGNDAEELSARGAAKQRAAASASAWKRGLLVIEWPEELLQYKPAPRRSGLPRTEPPAKTECREPRNR